MASRFGLEIRAVAVADGPGLTELLASSGRTAPAGALAVRLEAFRPDTGAALVAVDWGPPSGLIVAHWLNTLTSDLPVARISTLLVGPADRRRGIGRLLLKAVSQAARRAGCGTLTLEVSACDANLDAFCRATGFEEAGASFARPLRKKS